MNPSLNPETQPPLSNNLDIPPDPFLGLSLSPFQMEEDLHFPNSELDLLQREEQSHPITYSQVSEKSPFGLPGGPLASIWDTCRRHLICQFLQHHGRDWSQLQNEPEAGLLDRLLRVLEFKLLTYLSAPSQTYSKILELIRLYGQLTPLLKDKLHTQWDLTSIMIVSPCLCNWSLLFQSTIFPTLGMPYTPPFKSLSEINYFFQNETLFIKEGEKPIIYHSEARLAATNHSLTVKDAIAFPFGWSFSIEDYCHDYNYHPHCHFPNLRNIIKERFAEWAINSQDEDWMSMLDDHISTIHLNTSGQQFQWLQSSMTPTWNYAINSQEYMTMSISYKG